MLSRESVERSSHRGCRLADLSADDVVDVPGAANLLGQFEQTASDEPADAFRREMWMTDDLPTLRLDQLNRTLGKHGSFGMSEQDQRLLGDLERGSIDLNLRRLRKALDAVLAMNPPE